MSDGEQEEGVVDASELSRAFAEAFSSDSADEAEPDAPAETPAASSITAPSSNEEQDHRLYVFKPEDTHVHAKQTWDREYCFAKNPGEEFFHLLHCGELFVVHSEERFCLNCAIRRGLVTRDRNFWQTRR